MTQKKRTVKPPAAPPPPPAVPLNTEENIEWEELSIPVHVYEGSVLDSCKADVSAVMSLGDAVARFEDAILKYDPNAAAQAAFDVAWLARECGLRRGDIGNSVLIDLPPDTDD